MKFYKYLLLVFILLSTSLFASTTRNYHPAPSQSQQNDIYKIISTLPKNPATLAAESGEMKRAGKRIENVHPFRFLQHIFTNEELKAAVATIEKTKSGPLGKPWREFLGGLEKSLKEEAAKDNLTPFIAEFAASVKVNPDEVHAVISKSDWKGLVKVMLKIPRQGNPDRYKMN